MRSQDPSQSRRYLLVGLIVGIVAGIGLAFVLFGAGGERPGTPSPTRDKLWLPFIGQGGQGVPATPTPTKEPTLTASPTSPLATPTAAPVLDDLEVEWDGYPVVEHGSKLGVHGIHAGPMVEYAQDLTRSGARFPVVKAVDDLGWLVEIKKASPGTITIGRVTSGGYDGAPHIEKPETDLDAMAARLVGFVLEEVEADPRLREAVDYWEVVNEPDPPGAEGYRRLSQLMIACIEVAEQHDLKLAIFSLNNGTPEWNEMKAMVDSGVFGRAKDGGHILALHEGVAWPGEPIDLMWWNPDEPDPIPGAPVVEGAGALTFRYRYLYHLLEERDEIIPLVISEWYCARYESDGGTPADVLEAVRWYDKRAARDFWFWGFCPFTVGPTAEWYDADYTFAYPQLMAYMQEIRGRQNALPPDESDGN